MADAAAGGRPLLDARQPRDARMVERTLIRGSIDGARQTLPRAGRIRDRYKVFGTGEDKDVRLLAILVPRQPLVGLPGDCGNTGAPPKAERTVSRKVGGAFSLWSARSVALAFALRRANSANIGAPSAESC